MTLGSQNDARAVHINCQMLMERTRLLRKAANSVKDLPLIMHITCQVMEERTPLVRKQHGQNLG